MRNKTSVSTCVSYGAVCEAVNNYLSSSQSKQVETVMSLSTDSECGPAIGIRNQQMAQPSVEQGGEKGKQFFQKNLSILQALASFPQVLDLNNSLGLTFILLQSVALL